ncbi:MAG: STAS-like domain-containing protein [Bacteroidales bacterium]|nr:STAS-like domain-containing protein [Bacteroidales bacterium]
MMDLKIKQLKIRDIINRETAVSSDDGEIVYNLIVNCIKNNCIAELDFSEITILTTAFLNSAIGQLYNTYSSDQLNNALKLKNVADEDRILFKKVIERAKEYFANKKGFEDSANKAIYGS